VRTSSWLVAIALVGLAPVSPIAQTDAPVQSVSKASDVFVEHSANVFRRFNGDGVRTLEFYGEVLGFRDIGTARVGRGQGVSRYQVGPSQLKFTKAGPDAKFTRGAIDAAAGVRLWTMWFPDEAVLTKRFADHGFAAPVFRVVDGARSALLQDPDGEWVRLIVAPDAPKETYGQLEIGIAANDLEKSRAFYRTFVGLEELPAVHDALIGVTKYPFRHGSTTVSVWATPGRKPVNPQLAGIQYVVKPVDPIWALAQQRMIPVEQPLAETLPGLVTTWLYDPDMVTNYFAEIRPRPRSSQPTR
jgi:catechol 2,3-dioxygenase-like lactoylglutathione lyase family enzyme